MTSTAAGLDRNRFYIAGTWRTPLGTDDYQVIEAATEQPLGLASLAGPGDVDAAVAAARAAFDTGPWPRLSGAERGQILHAFADALATRSGEISTLVSRENGMPILVSEGSNGWATTSMLHSYADLAADLAEERPRRSFGGATLVSREAVGVVAAIVPWNHPQLLAIFKLAPALAAGCTVVLKPAPETALDAYALAEAAEQAGLPAGVVNIIPGDHVAGTALVSHPGVDMVAFTGSTPVGRGIGETCGRLLRPAVLELGGKSAAIVLDDADLDVFAGALYPASFMNNGQTCTTQSRILAPRSRYQEVVDAVATVARQLVVGDPLDRSVTCGPMVSQRQRDRVLGYVEQAQRSGARLVAGGGRPAGLDRGWYVEPTVFADVDNASPLAQEEVFGPVLAVIGYDDIEEAVTLANDSPYGLAGSVYTRDESRGIELARRIAAGTIGVNYYALDIDAPFAPRKGSGLGYECGPEGIDPYLRYRSIYTSAAQLEPAPSAQQPATN